MSHRRTKSKDLSIGHPLPPPSLVIPNRSDESRLDVEEGPEKAQHRDDTGHRSRREKIAARIKARREHRRSNSATSAPQDAGERSLTSLGNSSSGRNFITNGKRQDQRADDISYIMAHGPSRYDDKSSGGRPRSNSAVSPLYSKRSNVEKIEDSPSKVKSSEGMADFRKSLSRRSTQLSYREHSQSSDNLPSAVDASINHSNQSTPRTKHRNPFRRRKSSSEDSEHRKDSSHQTSNGSTSRAGKDRSRLATNASNDTLASNDTSSTPRMDFARSSQGDVLRNKRSISQWARRSLRADSIGNTSRSTNSTSTSPSPSLSPRGSQRNIEDWDNEFIADSGHEADSNNLRQAKNGTSNIASASEREEGLPKRLGGWLSNMLNNSINLEGNSRLSTSQSSSTVRHKLSSASLSLKSNSEGTASPQLAPIDTTAPSSANGGAFLKPRSAGVFSNLSASNRARAESPSSISSSSNGAKTGLDRALRYFLDNGEGSEGEEGRWLLGVWHGPEERDASSEGHLAANDVKGRDSRSSTMDGDTSSQSQRDSELDFDDNTTEEGSRKTRETSPSNASVSTEESSFRGHNKGVQEGSSFKSIHLQVPHSNTSSIQRQSSTSPSSQATGVYTASFQSDFSTRIWCTYRSHFVPITRDGTISRQAEMAAYDAAVALYSAAQTFLNATGLVKTGDTTPTESGSIKASGDPTTSVQPRGKSMESSPKAKVGEANSNSSTSATIPTIGHMLNVAAPGNLILNNTLGERMGLPTLWNRATAAAQAYGLGGRSGLTTDAGWGCMLRTGQSVLANALLNVHLGRSWRREAAMSNLSQEVNVGGVRHSRQEYAKYVQILSWFMDEPSLACPFGIHRMAREGKRLGKEVGEWFGPSTAGGAIKKLVDEFPTAGLGVTLASDGVVYLDQVRAQSQGPQQEDKKKQKVENWKRPVLILIGIRLGLEGVHTMYHDSIKAIFTFSQSVGIAGGRPSSSYYFVGYQGNSLFYLDPHHVRASIPFRHPPPMTKEEGSGSTTSRVDEENDWWLEAYSEAELSTFHTDRPRRMPMKTLDPSMLLGFLVDNEDSMNDFVGRVKRLPRPIFSILESMPKWMTEEEEGSMHEDERALESFSEGSRDDDDDEEKEKDEEDGQRSELTEISQGASKDIASGNNQAKGQSRRVSRPRLSVMSHETMTLRSDSNFELIDDPQAMAICTSENENIQETPKGGESNPIGSFTEVSSMDKSVNASSSAEFCLEDNDDVSAWEQVHDTH